MNIISRTGIAFCAAALCFAAASAQDIVITAGGDSIAAKVLKVSPNTVEYKKWINPGGPTYELPATAIAAIRYANGETETFGARPAPVRVEADDANAALAAEYNNAAYTFRQKKKKDKAAGSAIGILGIAPGSVLAGKELSVKLVQVENDPILMSEPGNIQNTCADVFGGRYQIVLTNNTDSTLYIDKALTTRTEADGKTKAYYDTARHDSRDERVLVLPPHASKPLSRDIASVIKGSERVLVDQKSEYYESFPDHLTAGLRDGETRAGDSSADVRRYAIVYSTDPEFRTSGRQDFGVYVRECIGFRYSNDTNLSPFNGEWKDLFRRRYISFGMKYDKFLRKYFETHSPSAIIVIHSWIEN